MPILGVLGHTLWKCLHLILYYSSLHFLFLLSIVSLLCTGPQLQLPVLYQFLLTALPNQIISCTTSTTKIMASIFDSDFLLGSRHSHAWLFCLCMSKASNGTFLILNPAHGNKAVLAMKEQWCIQLPDLKKIIINRLTRWLSGQCLLWGHEFDL